MGSGRLEPSQMQPVQATFSHSSQLSSAMASAEGKQAGQLNLNVTHPWSWEMLARQPEEACLGQGLREGPGIFLTD